MLNKADINAAMNDAVQLKATKLRVDYKSYLAQHEIVYEKPPTRVVDYLPIGNGDVGLFIDGTGSQLFGGYIMKTDVWDRRHVNGDSLKELTPWKEITDAAERSDHKLLKEMWRRELEAYYQKVSEGKNLPMPKVLGQIAVGLRNGSKSLASHGELQDYEQRLSLYDGQVRTRYRWNDTACDVTTLVSSTANLIIIHVDDISATEISRSVILKRENESDFGSPLFDFDSDYFWIEYLFPDGLKYAVAGFISGVEYEISKTDAYITANLPADKKHSFTVYLAIATNGESSDPLKKAKEILSGARESDYDSLMVSHQSWWHDFWGKSLIDIEDKHIENIWYVQQYLLACLSRGRTPPGVGGLWTSNSSLPWGGGFIDMAYCLMYTSCFVSNHPELAESFYRLCEQMLPGARRNAKELYGCRGARFAHDCGFDGLEKGPLWYRLQTYVSAFVGIIHWWGYLYTMDEKFLAKSYPLIKETVLFYEDLMERDSEGRYYLPPPNCPMDEINSLRALEVKNPTFDLAMVKRLLISAIKAAGILHLDVNEMQRWQGILDNFSLIPSDGNIFLNYEGEDPTQRLLITAPLGCIYPAKVVDVDNPACLHTINDNWRRMLAVEAPQCFSWPWIASSAAWIGRGDIAIHALYNQMKYHLTPNGIAVEGMEGNTQGSPGYVYGRIIPFISTSEVSFFFSAAVNEMLLQSLYEGIIRVFPGCPDWLYQGDPAIRFDEASGTEGISERLYLPWNARFANLRAAGAFLVSSERKDGVVEYIAVKSLVGNKCKVEIPRGWKKDEISIYDFALQANVQTTVNGKVVEFNTIEGHNYVIDTAEHPFESHPEKILSGSPAQRARKYLGIPAT